jgi:bifunctional non-homologous end joining protein LigD
MLRPPQITTACPHHHRRARRLPLLKRAAKLRMLLARSYPGIAYDGYVKAPGAEVFEQACPMGLEGIVSKRIDASYRSGRRGD